MQVYEKLNFLMNITKTSNSTLSHFISLDASYISRLRRGKRSLSKREIYVKSMAAYFAKHCNEAYQRKALFDAMNINPFLADDNRLPELIARWLLNNNEKEIETIENFLEGFSNNKTNRAMPLVGNTDSISIKFPQADVAVYYGVEGKREAVVHFLSEVIAGDKPQTLLLFSDEATDWMTTSPQFATKWFVLMSQTISRGNKIKIIHTVSRDLDEMLNAISQWMPLYMSGAIEPYFYPKKRDGVFKRTLFIAPDTAAVISGSVGNMHDQAANILFRNEQAVAAFAEEFNQYLRLCRPLMRIFTVKDEEAYMKTLSEFEKEQTDTIIKTESLSILTMPETLAAGIILRHGIKETNFLDYHKIRTQNFYKNIQSNSFTEIIRLPDVETIKSGKVKIAFSDMLSGSTVYYTAEEYILHLENLVHLLKTHENFHIYITSDIKEDSYMVYAREDLGTIVAKTSVPPVVLAMNENNMTAAFWDFLKNIIGDKAYVSLNNNDAVNKLCSFIQQLQRSLGS